MRNEEIDIKRIDEAHLADYAAISIAYWVRTAFRAEPIESGLGGIRLIEEAVVMPYLKDYDAIDENGPKEWPHRFDIRHWGIFLARQDGVPIGGAAVAFRSPEIRIHRGRDDVAVLWDLRIRPEDRGRGMGRRLFEGAAGWAREQGCRRLLVETQNTNVPACRFYARRGCRIADIDRFAYAGCPGIEDEIMLLWSIDL